MSAAPSAFIEPTVTPLPPILRGIAEAQTYLKLPDEFLRTWLEIGSDDAPGIPHFRLGQQINFPTEAVLQWLAAHHGYGEGMKHPSTRPKIKRTQPKA